jgi:hypothetical protein
MVRVCVPKGTGVSSGVSGSVSLPELAPSEPGAEGIERVGSMMRTVVSVLGAPLRHAPARVDLPGIDPVTAGFTFSLAGVTEDLDSF